MTDHNLTLAVPRLSSFPQPEVSSALVSHPNPAQLLPNHVLIRVDRFGFTANNVSYQALGEVPHFRWVCLECVGSLVEGLINILVVTSISTLLPTPAEYPRRHMGFSPSGGSGILSRPTTPSQKSGNVSTDTLPPLGTLVSACPELRPRGCLNFITVLEFSAKDLNNFFYYVPRPHLPPGLPLVAQ